MTFRELHQPGNPFVLANAWDIGSAKMLAGLGAKAIGTSSAAHAFTLGRPDGGKVTRDEALAHAQDLVAAVDVPVSGDFEDGFGEAPETCAETVRLSGEAGLAGICIEDTIEASDRVYDFDLAVERVRAASSAARALSEDFFFVARADGVMTGAYDIEEALRRIRAFDAAGADGLYVPIPKTMDDLKRVIDATDKPVNVLAAGRNAKHSLADYAALGAARISVGSALARATHRVIHDAGLSMLKDGDFTPLSQGISSAEVDKLLS
ncbi:isocitrate lyase/PEP mutase family protein [Litoreibacter janthinus]|uniref:2-Methylisocitrate lyase, PEP mutase family n=1 Tax=Litoreibacter janthinus TaxID=670154 RepID=A0A1I6H822_9RHOB|nr:isocitrate lyase/phosphoenolpyruvate mutase family protein [Litoreibacter janthinus]SFR50530.1 2-Methylisocitrate lyase, PEP mutase family [Litoreibacter janthinus]